MFKMLRMISYAIIILFVYTVNVQAEQVIVNVSANIVNINDPYGVISDVNIGDVISGAYAYDTATPDHDSYPEFGYYPHVQGAGYLDFNLGNYNFKTDQLSPSPLEVMIYDGIPSENYHAVSFSVLPTNGAMIDFVNIDLYGDNGDALASDQLLGSPPIHTNFNIGRTVYIAGSKNGSYFNIEAELTIFDAGPKSVDASVTRFTYKLTARAASIFDFTPQYLGGRLKEGDLITVYYTIDSSTPDLSTIPEEAVYLHAPGTGAISVEFANTIFSTKQTEFTPEVRVFNGSGASYDSFNLYSDRLESTGSELIADYVSLDFSGAATVLNNTVMPTENMSLNMWDIGFLHLRGDAQNWTVNAEIISLELVPSQMVDVVPGDAKIHPAQNFDVAIYLNSETPVIGVSGTLNGMDISNYLQSCQMFPPMNGIQSLVCFKINYLLMPGINQLHINLKLIDNIVYSTDVIWSLN